MTAITHRIHFEPNFPSISLDKNPKGGQKINSLSLQPLPQLTNAAILPRRLCLFRVPNGRLSARGGAGRFSEPAPCLYRGRRLHFSALPDRTV